MALARQQTTSRSDFPQARQYAIVARVAIMAAVPVRTGGSKGLPRLIFCTTIHMAVAMLAALFCGCSADQAGSLVAQNGDEPDLEEPLFAVLVDGKKGFINRRGEIRHQTNIRCGPPL